MGFQGLRCETTHLVIRLIKMLVMVADECQKEKVEHRYLRYLQRTLDAGVKS